MKAVILIFKMSAFHFVSRSGLYCLCILSYYVVQCQDKYQTLARRLSKNAENASTFISRAIEKRSAEEIARRRKKSNISLHEGLCIVRHNTAWEVSWCSLILDHFRFQF